MDANALHVKQLLTLPTSGVTAVFSVRARPPLARTHVPVTNAHLHMNTACARVCTSTLEEHPQRSAVGHRGDGGNEETERLRR